MLAQQQRAARRQCGRVGGRAPIAAQKEAERRRADGVARGQGDEEEAQQRGQLWQGRRPQVARLPRLVQPYMHRLRAPSGPTRARKRNVWQFPKHERRFLV